MLWLAGDPLVSITGFSGAVTIPVRGGGWRVVDGKLSFWLDFPEGSTRGDVAGDVANVWGLSPGVLWRSIIGCRVQGAGCRVQGLDEALALDPRLH